MTNRLALILLVFYSIGLAVVGTVSAITGVYLFIEGSTSGEEYRDRSEGSMWLFIAAICFGAGVIGYAKIIAKSKD